MNSGWTKEKRNMLCVVLWIPVILLGGCSSLDSLFTDTGTDVVVKTDASAYLNLSLLENDETQKESGTWNGYEVWTIDYGTFATEIVETRVSVTMMESVQVKAQPGMGSMLLTELSVTRNTFVEEGEVLARVDVEISRLDLEEQELKLKRLEEEYAQALEDYEKRHEEAVENISVYNHPGKIDRIETAQMELDFEQTKKSYESRIAEAKEQIEEMKELSEVTEITAPVSGYVTGVERLTTGQKLEEGTVICTIVPVDKLVLAFSDESYHYGYGMELKLRLGGSQSANRKEISVTVSSINGKMLVGSWGKTTTQISGDFDIEELLEQRNLMIGGQTNVMENVLLVPAKAVTVENSKYFVTLLKEDSTLEKKQFIPGGSNSEYYWVFRGLEQGMKIIVE